MGGRLIMTAVVIGSVTFAGLAIRAAGASAQPAPPEPQSNRGVLAAVEGAGQHGARYEGRVMITPLLRRLETDDAVRMVFWNLTVTNTENQPIVESMGMRYVNPDADTPLRKFSAEFVSGTRRGKLGIGSFGFWFEVDPNGKWRNVTREDIETRLVVQAVANEQAWMEWVSANRPE